MSATLLAPLTCSVIFISTPDGFYLSRRLDAAKPFHNFWQCPGGKLDEGESPLQGAVRELKEETGLSINPRRLKLIGKNTRSFPNGDPYIAVNYHIRLRRSEIPTQTEPHKSGPWKLVSVNELYRLKLIPGLAEHLSSI